MKKDPEQPSTSKTKENAPESIALLDRDLHHEHDHGEKCHESDGKGEEAGHGHSHAHGRHGHSHGGGGEEEEGLGGHGHSHAHGGLPTTWRQRLPCIIMIVLTFSFFGVELFFGFWSRSIALLADSYHMLSDVFALSVALLCLWIANRPSKYSTFGWVRSEVFGALINAVWLCTMCYTMALESIGRLLHPSPIKQPLYILIVGGIGLVINLIGIAVFHRAGVGHGHSHDEGGEAAPLDLEDEEADVSPNPVRPHRALSQLSQISQGVCHNHYFMAMRTVDEVDEDFGASLRDLRAAVRAEEAAEAGKDVKTKDKKNLNMHGAFLHIITDALGSIIVIFSASLAYFFPELLGKFGDYLDPVLSLVLVAIIGTSAISLVRSTAEIVLRLPPNFYNENKLKLAIRKVEGVSKVDDITCWTLVANRHLATADIEFCSAFAFNQAAPKIRSIFHKAGIHSLTIQPTFSCGIGCKRSNSEVELPPSAVEAISA